mmetsp:Transcript_17834/g.49817  ORF Transcript_17834/g.49817 Transcript_17834/m.49817 type:complete len:89 (-) Transcript_17834:1175-1441(-)|eukprot:913095-Pelagomonas_calceolata.AAC.3
MDSQKLHLHPGLDPRPPPLQMNGCMHKCKGFAAITNHPHSPPFSPPLSVALTQKHILSLPSPPPCTQHLPSCPLSTISSTDISTSQYL